MDKDDLTESETMLPDAAGEIEMYFNPVQSDNMASAIITLSLATIVATLQPCDLATIVAIITCNDLGSENKTLHESEME